MNNTVMLLLLLLVGGMSWMIVSVSGFIRIIPRDAILALRGNRTVIRCSTDEPTPTWHWKRTGHSFDNPIPKNGIHKTQVISSGVVDLIIENVTVNEIATYICKSSAGGKDSAVLAVVESLPSCHVSVQKNGKSAIELVENDTVSIQCKYQHSKNMPSNSIRTYWTDNRGNALLSNVIHRESNSRSLIEMESSIREVPAVDDNATVYTYTAIFGGTATAEVEHVTSLNGHIFTWSSNVIYVSFAVRHVTVTSSRYGRVTSPKSFPAHVTGDQLVCHADGRPPPQYKWTTVGNNNSVVTVAEDRVLYLYTTGNESRAYRCTASNVIGNITHSGTSVFVEIEAEINGIALASATTSHVPVSLVFMLSIIVTAIVGLLGVGFSGMKMIRKWCQVQSEVSVGEASFTSPGTRSEYLAVGNAPQTAPATLSYAAETSAFVDQTDLIMQDVYDEISEYRTGGKYLDDEGDSNFDQRGVTSTSMSSMMHSGGQSMYQLLLFGHHPRDGEITSEDNAHSDAVATREDSRIVKTTPIMSE